MNIYLVSIIKGALLAGAICLLLGFFLVGYLQEQQQVVVRRRLSYGLLVLTLGFVLAFFNGGYFRGTQFLTGWPSNWVHYHEQYHFYFGDKYVAEVGYDGLYQATMVANQELGGAPISQLRDLTNFDVIWANQLDSRAVKTRFTAERWQQFKADLQQFNQISGQPLAAMLTDHGNTASPVEALLAVPLTAGQLSLGRIAFLSLLDVALLVLAFGLVWRAFGARTGLWVLLSFLAMPFVYDYLGGSLLRFDWLAAILLGCCAYQWRRPLVAGLLFGYAVLSRLFPVFLLVGLLAWLVGQAWRKRAWSVLNGRFWAGVALSLLLGWGLSSLYFGPSIWSQYRQRITTSYQEQYYSQNYSYKMLFVQEVDQGIRLLPDTVSMATVGVGSYPLPYLFSQLLLAGLFLWAAWRAEDAVIAIALGVPLIFIFLVTNGYYWSLMAVFALVWSRRAERSPVDLMVGLLFLALLIGFYYIQHLNRPDLSGYLMSLALAAVFAVSLLRPRS